MVTGKSEMQASLLLCLLFTLLVPGRLAGRPHSKAISLKHTAQSTEVQDNECGKVSDELCYICIDFADEAIDFLLDIIVGDGIAGSCGEVCEALAKRTSKLTGEICDVLCLIVGIDEFIRIIERIDIDPIYYCQLLDVCAVNDNGDAKITNASVTPKSGPQGDFTFSMTFKTVNGTGIALYSIGILTVDGLPVGQADIDCKSPGTYTVGWELNAIPDCETVPCEMWLPGIYNVTLAVCHGECYSKHPHSGIYDETHISFEITG